MLKQPHLNSLAETAKANGLKPYCYLRYLFEKLPLAGTEYDYRKLLPQNLTPEIARLTKRLPLTHARNEQALCS